MVYAPPGSLVFPPRQNGGSICRQMSLNNIIPNQSGEFYPFRVVFSQTASIRPIRDRLLCANQQYGRTTSTRLGRDPSPLCHFFFLAWMEPTEYAKSPQAQLPANCSPPARLAGFCIDYIVIGISVPSLKRKTICLSFFPCPLRTHRTVEKPAA